MQKNACFLSAIQENCFLLVMQENFVSFQSCRKTLCFVSVMQENCFFLSVMHGEEAAVEEEVSVDGKIFKVSVCRERWCCVVHFSTGQGSTLKMKIVIKVMG